MSLLAELGLTQYEAKCFVALTRIPNGTAKEISRLADVPYSRVYDSVESLRAKGLVDLQPSDDSQAQRFQAVRTDVAVQTLREEYETRLDTVDDALHGLAARPNEREQQGIWTISGPEHVARRGQILADEAESEIIVLVAATGVLNTACVDALASAAARGVTVIGGAESESARDQLREAVSPFEPIDPDGIGPTFDGLSGSIGRIMLVDREAALVSTLDDGTGTGVPTETAVWSRGGGPGSGIVTLTRELLLERIEPIPGAEERGSSPESA